MNSRTKIEAYLKNWTNTQTNPKFGVLIEGNWGAGKTHFINSILANKNFTKKKTIYLSLFGVNSIGELETRLFFASASTAQKTIHQGASVAGALIKSTFRFDLNGDDKTDGSINANFTGLNKFIEKISKNLNEALIVFDDLERCSIPMSEFLGFTNQFIEHGDARILFVVNTDKMVDVDKKQFKNFKEKVIGHHFKLQAQPEEALESFINEIDNKTIRKILITQSECIIELFHKSGYQNLRALRQFIWHYAELLEAIEDEYRKNHYFLQNLTEQFFVFFTEFKLDLGRNNLTPKDLISGKNISSDTSVYAIHLDKKTEPSAKYNVLHKYVASGYDTVVPVAILIDILQSGLVDSTVLNQHLEESKYLKSSNPAWRRFISFDKVEDDIVETAKAELLEQFDTRKVHDIGVMLHMFALRFMMSKHGIITDDIVAVENSCLTYIDDLLEKGDLPRRPTDWQWPNNFDSQSSYGHGYWVEDSYSDNFNNVYEHLNNARIQAFENQSKKIAGEILDALKTSAEKFTQLICHVPDGGEYASVPILHYIDVGNFIETWLCMPKSEWREVQYALHKRYETGGLQEGRNLAAERDWAIQLRNSLEASAASLGGYKGLRISRLISKLPHFNLNA